MVTGKIRYNVGNCKPGIHIYTYYITWKEVFKCTEIMYKWYILYSLDHNDMPVYISNEIYG